MRIKLDLASQKAVLHMPRNVAHDQKVTLEIVDARVAHAKTSVELDQNTLVMLITVLIDADKALDAAHAARNIPSLQIDGICDTHPRAETLLRNANQHHLIDGNDPAQSIQSNPLYHEAVIRDVLEIQPGMANAALEQLLSDLLQQRLEEDDLLADDPLQQRIDEIDADHFVVCDDCPCADCAPLHCGNCECRRKARMN